VGTPSHIETFVSIVVGLALADIAHSLHRLLRAKGVQQHLPDVEHVRRKWMPVSPSDVPQILESTLLDEKTMGQGTHGRQRGTGCRHACLACTLQDADLPGVGEVGQPRSRDARSRVPIRHHGDTETGLHERQRLVIVHRPGGEEGAYAAGGEVPARFAKLQFFLVSC
jgi:hypothetical protein